MFSWLYNAFISFVTYVLSFFGLGLDLKKKVHFEEGAEGGESAEMSEDASAHAAANVAKVLNGPNDDGQ